MNLLECGISIPTRLHKSELSRSSCDSYWKALPFSALYDLVSLGLLFWPHLITHLAHLPSVMLVGHLAVLWAYHVHSHLRHSLPVCLSFFHGAKTKFLKLGNLLIIEMYCSQLWRLGIPKSKCQQVSVQRELILLRWCLVALSSHGTWGAEELIWASLKRTLIPFIEG